MEDRVGEKQFSWSLQRLKLVSIFRHSPGYSFHHTEIFTMMESCRLALQFRQYGQSAALAQGTKVHFHLNSKETQRCVG